MLGVNESFEVVTLKDVASIGMEPFSPFFSPDTYDDPVCAVTLPASAAECVLRQVSQYFAEEGCAFTDPNNMLTVSESHGGGLRPGISGEV